MALNPRQALEECCREAVSYPTNNLRPGYLRRDLRRHAKYIDENKTRLFAPDLEALDFLELGHDSQAFRETSTYSLQELAAHLQQNHTDPLCRHMFVQAADSRSPLDCSLESFQHTMAFHQVSPSFLDYLYSFGDSFLPLDYSMTGFQSEDSLQRRGIAIPELGRSGHEIRVSYLLRSVEKSSNADPKDNEAQWKIRQTAVYHSFDLKTGRAFWFNIKASPLMKDTMTEAVKELPELEPSSLQSTSGAMLATLAMHLVYLGWCDGNWRQCINDAENEVREIVTKAKATRLESQSTDDPIVRARTFQKTMTMSISANQKKSAIENFYQGLRSAISRIGSGTEQQTASGKSAPSAKGQPAKAPSPVGQKIHQQMDYLQKLEKFSFGELQKLHHIGERVQEMRLVVKLDIQAMRDVKEFYLGLVEREGVPDDIRKNCRTGVKDFARKVDRIAKNLEIRLTQLETMTSWLADGKSLFDAILQYRNFQATRIFAEVGLMQGHKMEKIADKTEQETKSMHIITFVTLSFLPGTFVATFFQSGLVSLRSDTSTSSIQNAVDLNKGGFALFSAITFPLMAAVFVLWWILYMWPKRRKAAPEDEEAALVAGA